MRNVTLGVLLAPQLRFVTIEAASTDPCAHLILRLQPPEDFMQQGLRRPFAQEHLQTTAGRDTCPARARNHHRCRRHSVATIPASDAVIFVSAHLFTTGIQRSMRADHGDLQW
jgi:hypothetical protein